MKLDPNRIDNWQVWIKEGYEQYDKAEGDKRQRLYDYWVRINKIKKGEKS